MRRVKVVLIQRAWVTIVRCYSKSGHGLVTQTGNIWLKAAELRSADPKPEVVLRVGVGFC